MIKYRTEKVEQEVKVEEKIVCDVCKKEYDVEKDVIEVQEFQHIRFVGGYDSIFGDMNKVSIDICQHCFYEKFKDNCVVEDVVEDVDEEGVDAEKFNSMFDDGWRN